MDDEQELERIQQAKNEFAASQSPPIDPCTNVHCKYTGCVCGTHCGCGVEAKKTAWVRDIKGDDVLGQCEPCKDFKASKKKAKLEKEGAMDEST
mmetsp:Transcript_7327/g.10380  ORF Transcript_7327/g.10380 Transcript_7327/m.10380 type:complete len:94 (-) Transcript_7327:158-439(-)